MGIPAPPPIWAETGSVTQPTSGQISSGIVTQGTPAIPQKLPYQWFNWLNNSITAWINNFVAFWNSLPPSSVGINVIRNPGFAVAQRGTSGTLTGVTYTLDGHVVNGTSIDWSQVQTESGLGLQLEPSVSDSDVLWYQRIEAALSKSLGDGANVTFQATITNNTSAAITPTFNLNNATAPDDWSSSHGILSQALQTIPAGQTATVAYTFLNNVGVANGLQFLLDFGNQVTNGTNIIISGVNVCTTPSATLGLNNTPPIVQIPPIGNELVNCQRYYQQFGDNVPNEIFWFGYGANSTQVNLAMSYSKMRVPPTLIVSDYGNFYLGGGPGGGVVTNLTLNQAGTQTALLQATVASGITAGDTYQLQAYTTDDATLALSAEL